MAIEVSEEYVSSVYSLAVNTPKAGSVFSKLSIGAEAGWALRIVLFNEDKRKKEWSGRPGLCVQAAGDALQNSKRYHCHSQF